MSENSLIDIDNMLEHVGDFGRYQFLLMFLFSVINVLSGFHYFGQTFISVVPDHKCTLLSEENPNFTLSLQCSKTIFENDTHYEMPCTDGWSYNSSYGYVSIVQEFDWVCSDSWKPAIGQSVFFLGSVLGSLVLGVLADSIGRLHVLVMANMCVFVGNMITTLSANVTLFTISRFIAGCATDNNFVMMYIIVMEYTRPSMRTFGLNICIGVFYCLSCMVVPWVAVALHNWKTFLIAITAPHLFVLTFYCMVPESAQWLISKGKTEMAIKCFKKIAKINKKAINEKTVESLKEYCYRHVDVSNKHESLLGLFKTPKLRKKTLILIFKSMVMTLGYDAISRNVNGLEYSPFFIFSLTSLTILPACLVVVIFQDRVGRKALASGFLFLSGLFAAFSGVFQALTPDLSPVVIIILAIVARLCVTVAYNSGHQYAVELIPTVVRGQGVSAIHVAGYGASFFSAQILLLGNYWKPLPDIILGILLILGAISCLFLPETLNRTLPVTLQDGEDFGEDEGVFDFACCKTHTESTEELTHNELRL